MGNDSRNALIVGSGIGGLSAGLALRRAGWNIRIFERAASPRELGFGLGLAPSAMNALRELGVADVVKARGYAPAYARGEVRRMDGTVVKRAEFPAAASLGGQMLMALRPALHGALLEAVGADAITADSEAIGFTCDEGRVTLHLADGPDVVGDVLVGADGVGSMVRRALHASEPPPRSSNIIAVRGAVHGALHHLGELSALYCLGPGLESAFIRASGTGIYWFLSLAREVIPAGMSDAASIVADMSPRMDETFRAITAMTDELRSDELVDRDPLRVWGTGPVTLLGDAAHPMLPHTGQGAAQAIVDAVTLARALNADTDVSRALRSYERERQPKTATLVAQGRRTARVMRMTNPFGCAIREMLIRLVPVTPLVKLFVRINRKAGT